MIPPDLLPWLKEHRTLQQAQRAKYEGAEAWNSHGLIFTRPDGTPVPTEAYARAFAKMCAAAEIEDATPYAIRHTCCTLMVHKGVPLHVIAALLGHSDLTMLTKVYAHLLAGTVAGYESALAAV